MEHNYQIGRILGKGSFATVHLARKQSNNKNNATSHCNVVALKLIDLNNNNDDNNKAEMLQLLHNEIAIHSFVTSKRNKHHDNIVQFIESFSYNNNNITAMALEYCSGGDLSHFFGIRRRHNNNNKSMNAPSSIDSEENNTLFLSIDEIRHGISHILSGVAYLHSLGIVHRDIKGGNIYLVPRQHQRQQQHNDCNNNNKESLLTEYTLKIGDFGLAVQMNQHDDWDECQTTVCGTPSCLAPEVLRCCYSSHSNNDEERELLQDGYCYYGQPVDLWSTGCILYNMMVGHPPFALPRSNNNDNKQQSKMERIAATIDRVANQDWSIPSDIYTSCSSSSSSSVMGLLHQLLEIRPRKRGSAIGILEFHSFFNEKKGAVGCNSSHDDDGCFRESHCNKENVVNAAVTQSNHDDDGVPMEQCKNTRAKADRKRNLTPMIGLHRLPPNKYQWNDGQKQFTVFLLGYDGLVIQETIHDTGHWMHITCDGERVLHCEISMHDSQLTSNDCVDPTLREAFEHVPSSMTCIKNNKLNHDDCHTLLNSLLHRSKKPYLRLYRTAERLIQTVKCTTPQIMLYLYSSSQHESSDSMSYRMFAKIMLMENGPRADIEVIFVEGTTFIFRNMNQRVNGQLIVQWQHESIAREWTVDISSDRVLTCSFKDIVKLKNDQSFNENMVDKLKQQFLMAQSACIECWKMEEQQDCKNEMSSAYPISVRVYAASSDRRQWIKMEESDVSR